MSNVYRCLALCLGIWLIIWMVLSWPAVQDDAFIHLRYASNLIEYKRIAYNGTHPDFGDSSLLYLVILAALRHLTLSANLPRFVSSCFHCTLVLVITFVLWNALGVHRRHIRLLALIFLFILAAPSAVRWLDDGMETSLCLCIVTAIVVLVRKTEEPGHVGFGWAALGGLAGFCAVLVRIDLFLLVLLVSGGRLLSRKIHKVGDGKKHRFSLNGALLLGATVALLLIRINLHSFLPDAAIAKAGGIQHWKDSLSMCISAFPAAMIFGMGMFLFWLLTMVAMVIEHWKEGLKVVLMNSAFPLVLSSALVRGQALQGIRYLVWPLFFSCLWNLMELAFGSSMPSISGESQVALDARVGTAAIAIGALVLALLPMDAFLFYRLFRVRSQSTLTMELEPLYRLKRLRATAYDVGFIGYFTGSPMCDIGGIVNGRAVAQMDYSARLSRCAASQPEYTFGNDDALSDLNGHLDISKWSICGEYDFRNVMHAAPHYLVAAPGVARYVCGVTGAKMVPVAGHLHPPSEAF